jgi:site-specific DNA-methyltransferase (adenine-specific)
MQDQQLLAAFAQTNDGYSLDRVLADPELGGRFVARCRFAGLVGEPRVWNWRLLNLRKQGLLADIPTSRRTEVSWEDCDAYSYGSEIALSLLLAEGYESVDEVLCDPLTADRFDRLAASFAPGHSPFEYRWAAIKLRKDAKLARTRATLLTAGRFSRATPVANVDWTSIPESAGIYVVGRAGEPQALYVGESFNLRARLKKQFEFARPEVESAWQPFGSLETLEVSSFVAEPRSPELLAFQSLVARQHKSRLNFPELVRA